MWSVWENVVRRKEPTRASHNGCGNCEGDAPHLFTLFARLVILRRHCHIKDVNEQHCKVNVTVTCLYSHLHTYLPASLLIHVMYVHCNLPLFPLTYLHTCLATYTHYTFTFSLIFHAHILPLVVICYKTTRLCFPLLVRISLHTYVIHIHTYTLFEHFICTYLSITRNGFLQSNIW